MTLYGPPATRHSVAVVCVIAVLASLSVSFPEALDAQDASIAVTLPNPDGRDPVFDQSSAGQSISIEFLDLATSAALSLDDSAGSLRLINFWATWCTPCIKELPSLAGLASRYSSSDFQVIPVSLDQKGAPDVPEFIADLGVQGLTWYVDPTATSGQTADVFVLPTSIIVDSQGRELGRIVGSADWESTAALALVDILLGSRAAQD